jgi:predicted DNA-binding protein (MmcQ/YjbR family)
MIRFGVTITDIRNYCLSMPYSTHDFPFDSETCVFRIGGRMFCLMGINGDPPRVSLKCDPALARDLRDAFGAVEPGYHLNKEHWNTVAVGADLPDEKVRWLIEHSYQLVAASLPKRRPESQQHAATPSTDRLPTETQERGTHR